MAKWSASRINCFIDCPLKYKLSYQEGWKSTAPVNTQLADKGLAFHEAVEKYHTGMPQEELWKILEENIKKYNINVTNPEKDFYYDYHPAMEKFFLFWEKFIIPKEKEGYKILKEGWVNGKINDESFCGALDLCLEKDNNVEIFDYKSGKSVNANSYKPQQILYAYLKGKEKGWTVEETAERIKLYIFGPMQTDLENKTVEQNMLRGVKQIKYTAQEMQDLIESHYIKNISAIHTMNWARAQGNITHSCSWCPYCGAKPNDKGFSGCPKTVKAGFASPDNVEFYQK